MQPEIKLSSTSSSSSSELSHDIEQENAALRGFDSNNSSSASFCISKSYMAGTATTGRKVAPSSLNSDMTDNDITGSVYIVEPNIIPVNRNDAEADTSLKPTNLSSSYETSMLFGSDKSPILTFTPIINNNDHSESFFSLSNTKNFETFKQERQMTATSDEINSSDYFILSLIHPMANPSVWKSVPVEILIISQRDNNNNCNKQLAICSMNTSERKPLLFPPFGPTDLYYQESESNQACIVLVQTPHAETSGNNSNKKIILTSGNFINHANSNNGQAKNKIKEWQINLNDIFPSTPSSSNKEIPPSFALRNSRVDSIGLGINFSNGSQPLDLSFPFTSKLESRDKPVLHSGSGSETRKNEEAVIGGGGEVVSDSSTTKTPTLSHITAPEPTPKPTAGNKPIKNTRFKLTPERIALSRDPTPSSTGLGSQQCPPELATGNNSNSFSPDGSTAHLYNSAAGSTRHDPQKYENHEAQVNSWARIGNGRIKHGEKQLPINKDKKLPPEPPLSGTVSNNSTGDKPFPSANKNKNSIKKKDESMAPVASVPREPISAPPTAPLPSLEDFSLPRFGSRTSLNLYLKNPTDEDNAKNGLDPPNETEENETSHTQTASIYSSSSEADSSLSESTTCKKIPTTYPVNYDCAYSQENKEHNDSNNGDNINRKPHGNNNHFVRMFSGGWKNLSSKLKRSQPKRHDGDDNDRGHNNQDQEKLSYPSEPKSSIDVDKNVDDEMEAGLSQETPMKSPYRINNSFHSPEDQQQHITTTATSPPKQGRFQVYNHNNKVLNIPEEESSDKVKESSIHSNGTADKKNNSCEVKKHIPQHEYKGYEKIASLYDKSVATSPHHNKVKGRISLFRGLCHIAQWQNTTWVPLVNREIQVEIVRSNEGQGMILGEIAGERSPQGPLIVVYLSPKNKIQKSTALDIQVVQTTHVTMFRLRSSNIADKFYEAIQASRKDVPAEQPLVYANQPNSSAPSMASSNSSLGSVTAAIPPPIPGLASTPSDAQQQQTFNLSLCHEELLLLNKLKCKLYQKEPTGKWSDGLEVRMSVYSVPESSRKKVVLYKDSGSQDPSTKISSAMMFSETLKPICFQRVGKVGISIRREDEELGPTEVIYMAQMKGDKEARYVNDLLTSE